MEQKGTGENMIDQKGQNRLKCTRVAKKAKKAKKVKGDQK